MILTLAIPAYAQSKEPKAPTLEQMMDAKTPDQKERQADKAYRESLKKFPTLKLLLTHGEAFCPFSCFFRVLLKTLLWRRCFA